MPRSNKRKNIKTSLQYFKVDKVQRWQICQALAQCYYYSKNTNKDLEVFLIKLKAEYNL